MKKHRIIGMALAGIISLGAVMPANVSGAEASAAPAKKSAAATAENLQDLVDELPSLDEYDHLSFNEKKNVDRSVDDMLKIYYSALSDEDRRQVKGAELFAMDLYADSYAYYETEEEYEGQLTLEDMDKALVSGSELSDLQDSIDSLPDLAQIADVKKVQKNVNSEQTQAESIAASDKNTEIYYTPEEMDQLFLDVSDLADTYYSLEESQAKKVDEIHLTSLVAFLSTGVSSYARASVGKIQSYATYRYSGSLTENSPKFGYYTVATDATDGKTRIAFCADSQASTPGGAGTSLVSEKEITDRDVRVILYYGYGGPGECVSHNMNGYAETHYAIDWALDKASSNRQLASAAYKKLYTDQADKSVGDTITAYAGSSGVSGTQELIYYKYTPKPEYGYLYLAKRGATTHDVLLGAEYYVYKNASCTSYANDKNGNHTLRVNSENSPYSNRLTYEPGTYYVRESSKVPKGTRRDTAVYKVTVKAGQSSWVSSKGWNEDIEYGAARIRKTDNTDPSKTVPGATYRIYKDKACTIRAKSELGENIQLVTTAENSNTVTVAPGTYYIKEYKAAEGYLLSDAVYPITVTRGSTGLVEVTDSPNTGSLKLKKESADPDITADNKSYSLKGAVYGVYGSKADAGKDTNRMAVLTTNEKGETETLELKSGTEGIAYYIKEITPSAGFELCDGTDGSDQGIHTVTVKTGKTAVVTCREPVVTGDFPLELQKYDEDTGLAEPQGTAGLEGAVFAVEYWNNNAGNTSGIPDAVWYYRTDKKGHFSIKNMDDFISRYTFGKNQSQTEYAGKTITSSPLKQNEDGNICFYMGTYRVREISPPKLYQLSGTMRMSWESSSKGVPVTEGCVFVMGYNEKTDTVDYKYADKVIQGDNLSINAYDQVHLNMLTVTKYGSGQKPLSGVTYKLVRSSDGTEIETRTTGSDGQAVFQGLVPGEYILTEIQTAEGYNLLKEAVTVTLPCQMTEKEVLDKGADISKAYFDEVSQTFCFETVNYDITDSAHFDMPLTGGNHKTLYLLLTGAFGLMAAGLFLRRHING